MKLFPAHDRCWRGRGGVREAERRRDRGRERERGESFATC